MKGATGRIIGDKVDIKNEDVQSFFEAHTQKDLKHRYNYVLFQDDKPELALERDRSEKDKIIPLMELNTGKRVLDIGCGIGRWADEIIPLIGSSGEYIGVDFSSEMIAKAREEFSGIKEASFYVGAFQDILEVLKNEKIDFGFDLILVNGVTMYLNDDEIEECLGSLGELSNENTVLYMKESCGVEQRFTLKDFFSEELTHDYNAIYRSTIEYENLLINNLSAFHINEKGFLFPSEMINRKETADFYWILKKV